MNGMFLIHFGHFFIILSLNFTLSKNFADKYIFQNIFFYVHQSGEMEKI